MSDTSSQLLLRAATFAAEKHKTQLRKNAGGPPYDKSVAKAERKRRQVEHAPLLSPGAKLVKLADKICNVRDVADDPPKDWPLARRQEYFDWAKSVVDRLRGVSEPLESKFDQLYARRPR